MYSILRVQIKYCVIIIWYDIFSIGKRTYGILIKMKKYNKIFVKTVNNEKYIYNNECISVQYLK